MGEGRRPRKVLYCAAVSDLHCGCQLGLHPPQFALDGGGTSSPSPLQAKTWTMWEWYWGWVARQAGGAPYHVVVNGDAVNGIPHGSTNNWTDNLTDQCKCAAAVLRPIKERCERSGGRFFLVRGTASHVGKSAEQEEILGDMLGASGPDGLHSYWELWLELGGNLVHFLHHIGTTSSTAYESSALMSEFTSELVEAARSHDRVPDCIVRSHRHRAIEVRIPLKKGKEGWEVPSDNSPQRHRGTEEDLGGALCHWATASVTAAWQLKTPFSFKIPGARLQSPQVGGTLLRVGDEGIYTKPCIWTLDRPRVEG